MKVLEADTQGLKEECYRIRWEVYCKEKGWEEAKDGMERDKDDERSLHLLLQNDEGRWVGTIRLILPEGQISRHAILKDYRTDYKAAFSLYEEIERIAKREGLLSVYSLMTPRIARVLKQLGKEYILDGELLEHHGKRGIYYRVLSDAD